MKRLHRWTGFIAILFCLALPLTGCNGGGAASSNDSGAVAIAISPRDTTVAAGSPVLLTITATNTGIIWPGAGEVEGYYSYQDNLLTWMPPLDEGTYTFTVTAREDTSKSATARVTVIYVPEDVSISITPRTASVDSGKAINLTVTAAGTNVRWPAYGEVEGSYSYFDNKVTWMPPAAAGTYEFTVSAVAAPDKTATARVTVIPAEDVDIAITPRTAEIDADQAVTLTVTAIGTDIVWPASGEVEGAYSYYGNTVTWTPPATAGTYEFTVAAAANPSLRATARVTVAPVSE